MSGICTETVESVHAYTRVDVPWEIAPSRVARLFRYLSSGGMRTFGRTVQQMACVQRKRRFVVFALVFALVWSLLYFL